jgi:single-stranded-DNA-specific exonuclease
MHDNTAEISVLAEKYAQDFSIPVELARIVARRFPDYIDARSFLMPQIESLHDPALIPDMNQACRAIADAIGLKENILIYAHDDPDGYTSAAILYKTLADLRHGEKPDIFVYPIIREKDGYILNEDVLREFMDKGVRLVVTVDFGISSEENFLRAKRLGLKLVICDHHETTVSRFPVPAVDPKRFDSKYPFRELAGVGVTFKLSQALYSASFGLGKADFYRLKREYFAIAMIGTIADRVAAVNENRVLCRAGISAVRATGAVWAEYLNKQGEMTYQRFNADVIPALQAAAGIDPGMGVKFFLSRDEREAHAIFTQLKTAEESRRSSLDELFSRANAAAKVFPQVVVSVLPLDEPMARTGHADASPEKGVPVQNYLGAVSSKLRDRFQRAAVTIAVKDGKCHGELRTTGVDLYMMLSSMRGLFFDFGGHKKAAGFSMREEHLDRFTSEMNEYLKQHRAEAEKRPAVPETQLDRSQVRLLEPLMPFGDGNPAPVLTDGVDLYTIDNRLNIIELGLWQT